MLHDDTRSALSKMTAVLSATANQNGVSGLSASYEVVALYLHSLMIHLRFQLEGLEPDHLTPQKWRKALPGLPSSWNDGYGSCSFIYSSSTSPALLILRVKRAGANFEVSNTLSGDGKVSSFEKATKDYIDSSSLPIHTSTGPDGSSKYGENLEMKLGSCFVSFKAMEDLVREQHKAVAALGYDVHSSSGTQLKSHNLAETLPRLTRSPNETGQIPERPVTLPRPGLASPDFASSDFASPPPRFESPTGEMVAPRFEDEHGMNHPPVNLGRPWRPDPSHARSNIGFDDLNPPGLASIDHIRPSLFPGSEPMGSGNRGMHPTFDDPLFSRTGPGRPDIQGQGSHENPWPGNVPPGARYDPVGPGGPRFPGQGGLGRGSPFGSQFGGGFS